MYGIMFTNLYYEPEIGKIVKRDHFGKMKDFIKYSDGYGLICPELKIVKTYKNEIVDLIEKMWIKEDIPQRVTLFKIFIAEYKKFLAKGAKYWVLDSMC